MSKKKLKERLKFLETEVAALTEIVFELHTVVYGMPANADIFDKKSSN